MKKNWLDSAIALSKLKDTDFNYKYAKMGKNPVMNEVGTAASPVYGGSMIYTKRGWEVITPSMAEATGRAVYSNRSHEAYDISKTWSEEQQYGTDEYFTALEAGNFDIRWDSEGAGVEIVLTSSGELYQHILGHNFTDSIDAMTELLILNGTTKVAAGTVFGKYQDYETNESTGSHSHWEVYKLAEGIYNDDSERIDNNDWLTERYGSNPYTATERTQHLSGLSEPGTYEYNMNLTKKYASEEYWNYRSYREFGIELSTRTEFLFYVKDEESMDVMMMKRRIIAILIFGIILTVNAFCEYEIRIIKPLPAKYLMESYIWLNDEEIVYKVIGNSPSQLRRIDIINGTDELLLDGEARDEEYSIYYKHPLSDDKKSIIIGKSEGNSNKRLLFLFNTVTRELKEIKVGQKNNLGFDEDIFAFAAGKNAEGITYYQHYLETGNLIRYDYTWEESGIQKVIYNGEFFKVSDVMSDSLLITQIGRSSAINYLTHFDGDGFSRAVVVPNSDSQRSLKTNWGAYFLKDGNILFGEDMGDDTDYFDPDEAYCRLRICNREGDTIYTFDDFLYMRDAYQYFTMSPDRTKIIIQGYDMTMWPPQTKPYLLEILYK